MHEPWINTYCVIDGKPEVTTWNGRDQFNRWLDLADPQRVSWAAVISWKTDGFGWADVDVVRGSDAAHHFEDAKSFIQANYTP